MSFLCWSGVSPGPSAAAIPPCAHLVEPSSILAFVTSKTDKPCDLRFNAVVRPATPEPITTTSAEVLQPGLPVNSLMILHSLSYYQLI